MERQSGLPGGYVSGAGDLNISDDHRDVNNY